LIKIVIIVKLYVYHTPEQTPSDSLPDCAVVIDVLRATTTIATALHFGAEAVQAFSNIDTLMTKSAAWIAEKRLRAGERGGKKVEGFDLGNSPLDCNADLLKDKRLFITTTNGTRALQRVEKAPHLITAAFINRQAAVNYLLTKQPETVWMVGSGWEGTYSIEDTACAGAVIDLILNKTNLSLAEITGNDEVVGALSLYKQWQNNLLEMFHHSSHGKRLLGLDCQQDLKYCADTDILDTLPIQKEPSVLISL
jgi:2-phosphosulfolactate phosphatase